MKVLGLITARGGSKRIPGKNIRPLGGIPLIVWSIDVVRGLPEICDTLVSTDDTSIASVAREAGALVPWLRPEELATDTARSVDVCLHALEWYEAEIGAVDGLLLLQPTSPLRSRASVEQGLALFRKDRRPVVAFSPARSHPLSCYRLANGTMIPIVDSTAPPQSQELPPTFVVNGALYLISPTTLRKRRSFLPADMVPLILDRPEEGVDIDTEWDWMIAETALRRIEGSR